MKVQRSSPQGSGLKLCRALPLPLAPLRAVGRPVSLLPPGEGLLLGFRARVSRWGVASLGGDLPQSACGLAARGRTVDHLEERDTLEELLSPSPFGTRRSPLQPSTVRKLAEALGVKPEELVS